MEEVIRAAREGDEGAMVRLLDNDPTLVEREDDFGTRPMLWVAQNGHLGVMRLLVQRDADINATDRHGSTALHWAAGAGHEDMTAFLLGQGAHAQIRTRWDQTPLMWVCSGNHVGTAEMLLQHTGGRGLDDRDVEGEAALHQAAAGGHEEMVAWMLRHGAQADIGGQFDMTPLIYACKGGRVGVVRIFAQHLGAKRLDERDDEEGWTALHQAARRGRADTVRALLFAGADPSITDWSGRTPRTLAQEEPGYEDHEEEQNQEERETRGLQERRADCVAVFDVSRRDS